MPRTKYTDHRSSHERCQMHHPAVITNEQPTHSYQLSDFVKIEFWNYGCHPCGTKLADLFKQWPLLLSAEKDDLHTILFDEFLAKYAKSFCMPGAFRFGGSWMKGYQKAIIIHPHFKQGLLCIYPVLLLPHGVIMTGYRVRVQRRKYIMKIIDAV